MGTPGISDRVTILGRTGSGKTQFAIDFLCSRPWDRMPWIIFDQKGEKLLNEIDDAMPRLFQDMKLTDKVPSKPGLYRVRYLPDEDAEIEDLFLRIWKHENCGVYIDEGYSVPQALPRWKGFTYLLTQGRSKNIPMIVLYQRPRWMNRHAIEQADYFAVFQLNSDSDVKSIMEIVKPARTLTGQIITPNEGLPKYHCIWYDVSEGRSTVLRPARSRKAIIDAFASKASAGKNRTVIL